MSTSSAEKLTELLTTPMGDAIVTPGAPKKSRKECYRIDILVRMVQVLRNWRQTFVDNGWDPEPFPLELEIAFHDLYERGIYTDEDVTVEVEMAEDKVVQYYQRLLRCLL